MLAAPRRFLFQSLRTRLTALFVGLFAVALVALAASLTVAAKRIAIQAAEQQLRSSSAVYDRLWDERAHEFQQTADLLGKDFGFREAIATGDRATATSALDNLKQRLRLRTAFVLGIDGKVAAGDVPLRDDEAAQLWQAFDGGNLVGVGLVASRPRQVVAAPVFAPQQIGWIVLAVDLDQSEMQSLEKLSPVPIIAGVAIRQTDGWQRVSGRFTELSPEDGVQIAARLSANDGGEPALWRSDAYFAARSLPSLDAQRPAALILLYTHSAAMATFRSITWAICICVLLGLCLVVIASWRTAGRITEPLSRLDQAVQQFGEGNRKIVEIDGTDELARLAASFNTMAGEIEQRERRITQLAFNDALTGLPNRAMFLEYAALLLSRRDAGDPPIVLFCLDLDNFKQINDTLGHPAGDELLIEVAKRLRNHSKDHFVARLGGDEFVILAALESGGAAAQSEAAQLLNAIAQPIRLAGTEIIIATSIGIALSGPDGEDVDTLLRHADLALYRAKESGRQQFCFFEEGLNQRAQIRSQTEAGLRDAIRNGEFQLHFQPLFKLKENRIGAFEALIRWQHPVRGMIPPIEFITIAEETGLIVDIGAWAMREACRIAATWPDDIRVAVNVSTIQFQRPGLQEVVMQALAISGIAPDRLEIEITESIFLDDSAETMQVLHNLKALGVRIALDDFGTGYSSLSYLQSFPFDKIKIDRSFVKVLGEQDSAAAVVRAITDLSAALGMETTAEGVEEQEQLDHLREQGCTSVQGYLFSRPIPAMEVLDLLASNADARLAQVA